MSNLRPLSNDLFSTTSESSHLPFNNSAIYPFAHRTIHSIMSSAYFSKTSTMGYAETQSSISKKAGKDERYIGTGTSHHSPSASAHHLTQRTGWLFPMMLTFILALSNLSPNRAEEWPAGACNLSLDLTLQQAGGIVSHQSMSIFGDRIGAMLI